jgi:hypothetical protein
MEVIDEGIQFKDAMKFSTEELENFRNYVRGRVLIAGDNGYDEARKVWNGMIDKRPALIVKCTGNADVINTIKFAREKGMEISVRGGGHNVAGYAICEGGVVIDLSAMNHVRVDPKQRTVRVSGGATLGDMDHETQAFGLAVPSGVVSKTGVAGLTLNGGMGFLTRKYGLTSDNLVGADMVTADGKLIMASEHQNQDLLWALKGGGGSFGVVTSFEFQCYPVGPEVWISIVMYPVEKAVKILRFFRDFMSKAPDEFMALALLWTSPDEEFVQEEQRGKPNVVIACCYSGPLEEGESALQPLREVDTPIGIISGSMPFVQAQRLFDADYPDGRRYYWKSIYLNTLEDEVIHVLVDYASKRPSLLTSLDVWALGGAMGRTNPSATAFSQRNSPYLIGIESNWNNPADDEANVTWARNLYRDLQSFSNGGTYLNFPGFAEEGEEMIRKTFGENLNRLRAIKEKYDPGNVFSGSLNILPATY